METDIYNTFNSCNSGVGLVASEVSKPLSNVEQNINWNGMEFSSEYDNTFKGNPVNHNTQEMQAYISYNSSMGYTEDLLLNEALQFQKAATFGRTWI